MTTVDQALSRIQAWLASCAGQETNAAIADRVGVDEKTVRQARVSGWNPTAKVIRRFEKCLPRESQ